MERKWIKNFYPLEFFLANGMIDYIFIVLTLNTIIFFNFPHVSANLSYFSNQHGSSNYFFIDFVVFVVALLVVVLWPLFDIFLVLSLIHLELYIIAYILIRLVVLVFKHDQIYSNFMDFLDPRQRF